MTDPDAASVANRYREIRLRIQQAAERAARPASEIALLGAGKRQPLTRLRAAYDAGLRLFGENRVQEGAEHADALPADIDWHLIGPLQSNKARPAARLFSTVHSIDRVKIARALDRAAGQEGRTLTGFLEINLGREASKHGFTDEQLDGLDELAELEHLRILGLMAIPPLRPDPEESRGDFRRLRELRDELFSRAAWADRPGLLSMGMSGDFEVAIEEGATHVRVGSLLFGPRDV